MKSQHAKLVALSAPSGAGKTTICKELLERNPDFQLSISATTRKARDNEIHGRDYFFLSEDDFLKKVEAGEFLEYEQVHGNYYGTLKSTVDDMLRQGHIILFDIDVNGAINIKKQYPEALLIFIRPPSLEELKERLKNRKADDESEIKKRLERLPEEYAKAVLFDHEVVNEDLVCTIDQIERIVRN